MLHEGGITVPLLSQEKDWDVQKHMGEIKWPDLISKALLLKPPEESNPPQELDSISLLTFVVI